MLYPNRSYGLGVFFVPSTSMLCLSQAVGHYIRSIRYHLFMKLGSWKYLRRLLNGTPAYENIRELIINVDWNWYKHEAAPQTYDPEHWRIWVDYLLAGEVNADYPCEKQVYFRGALGPYGPHGTPLEDWLQLLVQHNITGKIFGKWKDGSRKVAGKQHLS